MSKSLGQPASYPHTLIIEFSRFGCANAMKLFFRTLPIVLLVALASAATVACTQTGENIQYRDVSEEQTDTDSAVEATIVADATVLPDGTIATPTAIPVAPQPEVVADGLEIIWEAYNFIVNEYVDQDEVDPAVLAEAAVAAMVEALEDNHSSYISPETYRLSSSTFDGKFSGIGAQVSQSPDGKRLIIVAPTAEHAG